MNKQSPIGVFDSGLGGLTVAWHIRELLPDEDILFFGDSARNPYGTKPLETIQAYSSEIMEDFAGRDVKAAVIACNTATSAAAALLRPQYDFDIIGMEPALKVAAKLKTPSVIAVWATDLTLHEKKFAALVKRFEKDHTIIRVPCPKLVRCVEEDRLDDKEYVNSLLEEYLKASGPVLPDAIVLGCTHFIYYKQVLEQKVGSGCVVVDGNEGTARHLRDLLDQKGLLKQETTQSSDDQKKTETGRGSLTITNSDPDKIELSYRLYRKLEELNAGEKNRLAAAE